MADREKQCGRGCVGLQILHGSLENSLNGLVLLWAGGHEQR